MYVHLCTLGILGGQEEGRHPLKLELQAAMSCPVGALWCPVGTKSKTSVRAMSALNLLIVLSGSCGLWANPKASFLFFLVITDYLLYLVHLSENYQKG